MKGIRYITDEQGNRSEIVIDIDTYKEQIEDFLDGIEATSRMDEPQEDYENVFNRILKQPGSE